MIDEKDLLKYAKKNKEGFTVRIVGDKIVPIKASSKNRYVVANRPVIIYNQRLKTMKTYGKLDARKTYGGWYDKESGRYFIESNTLYSNQKKALHVGKVRNQIAIFDLLKMNEIRLQYPEGIKPTGINPVRVRNVVVKKGNRYYNKITKKYTTKKTGERLNRFFKHHPDATLYEAHSQPKYKKHEKWEKQSNKIVDLYKKKIQVIKTKDRFGNDVYYSPILKKRISKSQMKEAFRYDFSVGQFHISLYRMTADKGRVYHIIKTNIGRTFSLDDIGDFIKFEKHFQKTWTPEAMKLTRQIATKYPLHAHQVMYIAFNHEYYLTNYKQRESGAVTVMQNRYPHRDVNHMPGEINRAFRMYGKLISEYSIVTIREVFIYIYSFPTEKTKMLSEKRLGVFKRNGK